MPFKVVEAQPTPNPNATKFVLNGVIAAEPQSFLSAEAAKDHPIAWRLFSVQGVAGVLLLGDFVTVNKRPTDRWDAITGRVREILENA
jgi:hypothetical protein